MHNLIHLTPQSLDEALDLLRQRPEARILAGGTDLMIKWKRTGRPDLTVVSIRRLPELGGWRELADGGLFLGAGLTLDRLIEAAPVRERYPALARAAAQVGSVQVRNLATIGGNACNAALSADTAPPLIAYRAQAILASAAGERSCPLEDFFLGPGRTRLEPGELLKGLVLPRPTPHSAARYRKLGRRAGMDLATVGAAVGLTLDSRGEEVADLRVVLGAVGPTPILVKGLSLAGRARRPGNDLREMAAERALAEARPITDVRGSREYRLAMVRETVLDCFDEALAALRPGREG